LLDRFVEQALEVEERIGVQEPPDELQHAVGRGQDAVAARLGKERAVIALALIVVASRDIDDVRPLRREKLRAGEIVAGGDHLVRRLLVGEVPGVLDENHPSAHGLRSPELMMAAARRSRPVRVMWSKSAQGMGSPATATAASWSLSAIP